MNFLFSDYFIKMHMLVSQLKQCIWPLHNCVQTFTLEACSSHGVIGDKGERTLVKPRHVKFSFVKHYIPCSVIILTFFSHYIYHIQSLFFLSWSLSFSAEWPSCFLFFGRFYWLFMCCISFIFLVF